MSDIVQLMNNWRDELGYPTPGEMMDRAIAEITRLRDEVERLRANATNHNAAPAARADADTDRTDKAGFGPGGGTGDTATLTDAEREALVAADSELSAIGHHRLPDRQECRRISNLLRAILTRLGGGK